MKIESAFVAFWCTTGIFGFALFDKDVEGSKCRNDDTTSEYRNFRGTCKRVTECPHAVESLKKRHTHDFTRCGFAGIEEVVCCPESGPRDAFTSPGPDFGETTTTRRSTRRTRRTTLAPRTDASSKDSYQRKSAIACLAFANELAPSVAFQILGGEQTQEGEFPHMAALGYKDPNEPDTIQWSCGGSLIGNQHVLTAAHCIVTQGGSRPVTVRLGRVDLTQSTGHGEDFDVESIEVHRNYSRRSKQNDIALIKLSKKVRNTEFIHPACLYDKNDDPQPLVVTGWGQTSAREGVTSNVLLKATLNPVPTADCDTAYSQRLGKNIGDGQICAVSDDGTKDACKGDSGGPLQVQQRTSSNVYSIVGVTSYASGCGGKTPGVYTRVFSYLEWIESVVWP